MLEIKTGWWRTRCKRIVYVVGVSPHRSYQCVLGHGNTLAGDLAWNRDGSYMQNTESPLGLTEHLPDCTGFDWVPSPKWVAWDLETCPLQSVMRYEDGLYVIGAIRGDDLLLFGVGWRSFRWIFEHCKQLDGKPAGRLV